MSIYWEDSYSKENEKMEEEFPKLELVEKVWKSKEIEGYGNYYIKYMLFNDGKIKHTVYWSVTAKISIAFHNKDPEISSSAKFDTLAECTQRCRDHHERLKNLL